MFGANVSTSTASAANLPLENSAPVLDLPESICVETQLLPRSALEQHLPMEYDMLQTMSTNASNNALLETGDFLTLSSPDGANEPGHGFVNMTTLLPSMAQPIQLPPKPEMLDASMLTDSPNPLRERGIQTAVVRTVHAMVQCDLYKEQEEQTLFNDTTVELEKTDEQANAAVKAAFLQFVEQKSSTYSNGKCECLVCGEIKTQKEQMLQHMCLHWGPAVLCWQCGHKFEHEKLLKTHKCPEAPYRKNKQLYKCPFYACLVSTMSLLELYDHINEHTQTRLYRCYSCRKRFMTAGELRHHKAMRLCCMEAGKDQCLPYGNLKQQKERVYRLRVFTLHSTKRKVLVKTFLSQRKINTLAGIGRCQICLLRCQKRHQLAKHYKRCLKDFVQRLKSKRAGFNV